MSLPQCDGALSPAYIKLFLNISVNCVEVKGPIRRFGVDYAGRLHAAVRSMLAVYEKTQVYLHTPAQRCLYYIYVQGRTIELQRRE